MLRFVIRKIVNRKWLNGCLLAGLILLIGICACHPMFRQGAGNQILQGSFVEKGEKEQSFPMILTREASWELTGGTKTETAALYQRMDAYEEKWLEYLPVDPLESVQMLSFSGNGVTSDLEAVTRYLTVGCMRNLKEHVEVADGSSPWEQQDTEVFPCAISESVMDAYGMVVGERLWLRCENGESVPFEITGILKPSSDRDFYWNTPLTAYNKYLFVSEETMDVLLQKYGISKLFCRQQLLLDYFQLSCTELSLCKSYAEQFLEADPSLTVSFLDVLQDAEEQIHSVSLLLWALELPCMVLLLLFLYMVSTRLMQWEEGEMAVLRSRGVTRGQILKVYLLQSGILCAVAFLPGILLGYGLCRTGAKARGFLSFSLDHTGLYSFCPQMLVYGLAACIPAILFLTVPAWKRSAYTITEQKSHTRYEESKPFWIRAFLDLALLAVSLYLFYSFRRQQEQIAETVLQKGSMDPLLFFNASLFLFSCSLVLIRLGGYLAAMLDKLGKNRWKSHTYASFLQIRRTYYRQSILWIFLLMTIAEGVLYGNLARTVNENRQQRICYNVGADIRLQDTWKLQVMRLQSGQYLWNYIEPDEEPYLQLQREKLCESFTRVIEDDRVTMGSGKEKLTEGKLFGIHTREFGETAVLQEGLNEEHWFYALNALAQNADGVILSRNVAEQLQLSVGDSTEYTRYSPVEGQQDTKIGTKSVRVCAIVDAFPGYERYLYTREKDGSVSCQEQYLMVVNYASLEDGFGRTPYSIWIKKMDGVTEEAIKYALVEQGAALTQWRSLSEELEEDSRSAVLQVTNGMFTLSFLLSIWICCAGFLIYWILSMKGRELLFGVYRAMGMTTEQLNTMLLQEQLFGSLLPVLAGGAAGILGSALFGRLIAVLYLPQAHNIPLKVVFYSPDLWKLAAVLLAVAGLCYFILRKLLATMNITEALKLGED